MARPQAPVGAPRERTVDADYRSRLVAARDRLEAAMADCGDRELAPLTARYVDLLDRIKDLPDVTEATDVVDALAARRARGAVAPRQQRPASG